MTSKIIVREKADQAVETLRDHGVDLWITFARETNEVAEPMLPLIAGEEFIWPGMVLVSQSGRKIVICELHDAETFREIGVHEVYPYENSLKSVFCEAMQEIGPDEIVLNYSKGNNTADGLSHGLYLQLSEYLDAISFEGSLRSGEAVVSEIRGKKTSAELTRIQTAADYALEIFEEMRIAWDPGWTERDVARYMHQQIDNRDLATAWDRELCPVVTAGVDGGSGHTKPGEQTVPEGEVLRIDFGVEYQDYVSDMQRLYYHPETAEGEIPDGLRSAFQDVRDAIAAGAEVLKPGVQGYTVDEAARSVITSRGWPEYQHGLGHQVGRNVHDGGTYLGPRWERYGDSPLKEVHEGQVFTLELGIDTEWGHLAQEEMVQVTAGGNTYITDPQEELYLLPK